MRILLEIDTSSFKYSKKPYFLDHKIVTTGVRNINLTPRGWAIFRSLLFSMDTGKF